MMLLHALVVSCTAVNNCVNVTMTSTTTTAPFTVPTWFGNLNPDQTIVSLTLGWLAILAIIGFIFGLVGSVMIVIYKRRYGIIVKVIAEIGITYKEVFQKLIDEWKLDFRHKNHMYAVDLSRTAWLDYANRPVLYYEKETATPVDIENTTVKLKKVIKEMKQEAMKIRMTKDGKKPSDPFDLLFGRKAMEALVRAQKKVQGFGGGRGVAILLIAVGLLIGYLAGNYAPLQAPHAVIIQTNATVTHTTGVK